MERTEYIEWAKKRAIEFLGETEDVTGAYSSLVSDLTANDETKNHIGINLGMRMMMIGKLQTAEEMRRFIDGFH